MRIGFLTDSMHSGLTKDDQWAAQELAKRGHGVTSIVWNDPEALRMACAGSIDCIVVRSTWDYYRRFDEFLHCIDFIESQGILLLNSAEVLRKNCTKGYLLELASAGIPIVPTKRLERKKIIPVDSLVGFGWNKIVVKPEISAAADLTFVLESSVIPENANKFYRIWERSALLVQPYCESIETIGEYSLLYFRGRDGIPRYGHTVLKKPRIKDFRVQEEFGGSLEFSEPQEDLQRFSEEILGKIQWGQWLYARVDIVFYEDKPVLSELEMLEPSLYFEQFPGSAVKFVDALESYLHFK